MGGESIANSLFIASNVSFVAAVVFGIIAVILFFRFKIPSVINDLSGRSARKSIQQMRIENEKKGRKSHHFSKENNQDKKQKKEDEANPETRLIKENKKTDISSESTALLIDEDATSLLDQDETEPLSDDKNKHLNRESFVKLKMLDDVMIIHSDEIIE